MPEEKTELSVRMRQGARNYFRNLWDIRKDTMSNEELQEMMEENTIIRGSNMWILMLAILIASIGLNVNSTAVIIGAMLISPLMSGILTMGYSLAVSDLTMLKRAFGRFTTQVVISLITSTVYFLLSPLNVATSEMIARTSPTLWDVLIALFGGIAGMIGNTRQKKSNVIPGVAIATALMPPLCTAGYGIATAQPRFMLGAFYLFAINTLFIMLSSAFVTKLLRIPAHENIDAKKRRRIHRLIRIITVVTVIPSVLVGAVTVYKSVVERNVSAYLNNEFVFSDTQMVQSSTDYSGRVISVSLIGSVVSDEMLERLEYELPKYGLDGYRLHVTQNKLREAENTDKVTIAIQENTINELHARLEESERKIAEMESSPEMQTDCRAIAEKVSVVFTKLKNCGCGIMKGSAGEYILLTAAAQTALSPDEEQSVKNLLTAESGLINAVVQITAENDTEEERGTT